jgi:uncharacterized protein YacL
MPDAGGGSVLFVEVFRLLLVLAGVAGGLQLGDQVGRATLAPLVFSTVFALFAYVSGGVLGRAVDRGTREAVGRLRDMPPAEVFAGSVLATTGLLAGLALGLALVSLVHSEIGYPLAAVVVWVLCAAGARLGVSKGNEIVRAAGLGHLLERPASLPGSALLVDTSALLERHLVALGSNGLLPGGLVVPRFVLDEAHTLADGPDPVSARRATAGVEALDALRHLGVIVRVDSSEVPEHAHSGEKALALARRLHVRLATCSADMAEQADRSGVPVVNLRQLAAELAPHHPPGERLLLDLVKAGRQPRQAVGYLPDGDMVVVNDAGHLVGRDQVAVVVSGTRPTSQGLLLFARLADSGSAGPSPLEGAERAWAR